jgi:hypothetical protein
MSDNDAPMMLGTMARFEMPCKDSAFYWEFSPVVADYASVKALREAYVPGEFHHWFDRQTDRMFGVKSRVLMAGCCIVELQDRADLDREPDYVVTAWMMRPDGPEPAGSCHHETASDARACALAFRGSIARQWSELSEGGAE